MKYKVMTIFFALVLVAGFAASAASAKDGDRHESKDPEGVPFNASITAAYNGDAQRNFNGHLTVLLRGADFASVRYRQRRRLLIKAGRIVL